MEKEAKKRVGRPKGQPKKAKNLYLLVSTCDNLRRLAVEKDTDESILVERALKKTYKV